MSFIEAHGTGTALGDPVEISSLARVFDSVGIASLKGNSGHMEGTAGTGGLLNLNHTLKYNLAPTNAQLRRLNPNLEKMIAGQDLKLATQMTASIDLTGGVSSFGATGIIAHSRISWSGYERSKVWWRFELSRYRIERIVRRSGDDKN